MNAALQNIQRELDKCYKQTMVAHSCKPTDTACIEQHQKKTTEAQLKCTDTAEKASARARSTMPSTEGTFSANRLSASEHVGPARGDP